MRTDIYENKDNYIIEMDLPGFKKENINIEFSQGYLIVLASKKENNSKDDKNYIKRERTFGIYKREFYVGNVDYSKIFAKYKDGVLFIDVFKKAKGANLKWPRREMLQECAGAGILPRRRKDIYYSSVTVVMPSMMKLKAGAEAITDSLKHPS